MNSRLLTAVLAVGVASCFGTSVLAKEKAEGAAHAKAIKGVLSAKAADAPENVIAVLTTKIKKEEKKFNLTSSVKEVADQIKSLAEKGASVSVKGTATESAIDVTEITENVAKAKKEPKAKNNAEGAAGEAAPEAPAAE